ncbi:MAG: GAF domain-containing protein [Chloroflexi bacterium]|nr:GAF domain-containing protein [Chloroflexota bacterium]
MAEYRNPMGNSDEPRLLRALGSLNWIGAAINRIGSGGEASMEATLRFIVESAIKVAPGTSAVIYAYDAAAGAFDPDSRVSAGEGTAQAARDVPRPEGLGMRAIRQRRAVLSYEEADLQIHPENARARAAACFPLIVADEPQGALYVYLYQERPFTQLELLMLENFVNLAAMAIYHPRRVASVERDLARKQEELNRLQRAGMLISSHLRLEETLEAILQMALEVTNAQYGIFRLVDRERRRLVTRAIAGENLHPRTEALPLDESSIMGWVALHRQPVLIRDLRAEPWAEIYYPFDAEIEMPSELAVPLVSASGRLEGVLNLESPLVGAFTEEDSHLLQALATQAVIAIQDVRLLDALQEVVPILLAQPRQEVFAHLVGLAGELLNAAASAIWQAEGDELVLQAANAGYRHGERLPLAGSLAGQAVLTNAPVTADDMASDPRFHRPDLARAQGWNRALVVPIAGREEGRPWGAFSVYSAGAEPGRFAESEWDAKVLTFLAHYASLAAQNEARQAELRAARERQAVAETFAAVGDLAANLLHRLNNKVGSIPVRVEGIQDKSAAAVAADPYLAANLAEIERSAAEAMEVVRDNVAHLYPLRLGPVSVADCAREALAAARLPATLAVRLEGLEELPPVQGAHKSLAMVFVNLLENAREAMQGRGSLAVEGAREEGQVLVSVSDSGPGIPPAQQDGLFEASYPERPARNGRLGFGLWWVKTWMVRMGGSVAVESDGAHGTTFRLRLPVAEEG